MKKDNLDKVIEQEMSNHKIVENNKFPTEVFPKDFKDLIKDLKVSLNFPEDYTGSILLTAVATAIGNSKKLKVKEEWIESSGLYVCVLGKSGVGKSHPQDLLFKPIQQIDVENFSKYDKEIKSYNEYLKLTPKEKKNVTEVPEPVLKKVILSDFTKEILFNRLYDNPRGCVVLTDELDTFIKGLTNYSKNDTSSQYLSIWNNKTFSIDRVGNNKSIVIKEPFLSIVGGLQTRLINTAFNKQKMSSGFMQRFLFAFPKDIVKLPISDKESNKELLDNYSKFITDLYHKSCAGQSILKFDIKANKFFRQWQHKNCHLSNANNYTEIGEFISKFDNHFLRLALIIQIMQDPSSKTINLNAVKGAKKLCKYYRECVIDVINHVNNPKNKIEVLAENKQQFLVKLSHTFSTKEAIKIGKECNMKKRAVHNFLKNRELFKKLQHGIYNKN